MNVVMEKTLDQIRTRIKQIDAILKKNLLNIGEATTNRLTQERKNLEKELKERDV